MELRTLPDAATTLSKDLPLLAQRVAERLNEAPNDTQACAEILLDRLCLSVQLSKPIGLRGWAEREGRRRGSAAAIEIADVTIAVLFTEAVSRFELDNRRLRAFLDVAKGEIAATAAGIDTVGSPPPAASWVLAENTTVLLAALNERDPQTCAHSKAVGEWARRIAQAARLPEDTVNFIELCGVLHDIGKLATPDSILFKRRELTGDEWAVMREHAAAGQRILQQIPSLRACAPVVRAHHERIDGCGYPDGLAGSAIPVAARVVAVADAFHTMITDRPYQAAMAPWRACDVLRSGAGTQWDAEFVASMLGLFHRSARRPARGVRQTG